MPQFTQREGRFFVSYITGPSHVRLGLAFGPSATTPKLIREPAVGGCAHGVLDEGEILRAVVAGARDASENTRVEIHPTEIVYVENDSPRYSLYRYCAYLVAQRVMRGEPFSQDVE